MKKQLFWLAGAFLTFSAGFAQSSFSPVSVAEGTFLGETIPLRDFATVTPVEGTVDDFREIPNNLRNPGRMNADALPQNGDPLIQTEGTFRAPQDLLQNFPGIDISEGQANPPDPSGAVGPNHYVHAVNLVVKIFDKEGNVLAGPTSLGDFLGSGNNNGDPIVMYDHLVDRWFVSQFRVSDNALIVGVSTSPDPTDTFNVYAFPLSSFPDYPHYSVWPNAYFLTANKGGNTTFALDRAALIAGDPNPEIIEFSLPGAIRNPNTVFSPEPANLLGSTFPVDVPGYIVYLQDDGWSGAITFDHLKIWEIELDWNTPGNSTISAPDVIATQPFDSFFFPFGSGDIRQPNTNQRIDGIGGVISYMANYRSFGTHNSFLINFNVDLGGARSGIRWIELRNVDNGPFEIFQEGTWSRPDNESRFMGSMAMDIHGNIALGYNAGGIDTRVGIRFTGRLADDPLGQMTFEEQIIQNGVGIQTNQNRFGDYAQMTMDPDGETFWYTAEYFRSNNAWRTKIAAFNLDDLPILDNGDITANEIDFKVYPLNSNSYEIAVGQITNVENLDFEVVDITGKVIENGALNTRESGFVGSFSSSQLASGVYLVRIYNSAKFQEVKKIVIK